MKVDEGDNPSVTCDCGFKLLEDKVLRVRVALIDKGYCCPKCPRCKRFDDSFPLNILIPKEGV
jgi:hypothetical protein